MIWPTRREFRCPPCRGIPRRTGWLAGEPGEQAWLAPPEGANLAEQRAAGRLRLAALLGWLAGIYAESGPDQALRLDRLGRLLVESLADLEGQVSPAILFEELGRNLLVSP